MTVVIAHHADLYVPDRDGRQQPQGDRLAIRAPFAIKDAVKALPGARWAPKPQGFWHIPSTPESAGALVALLDRHELACTLDGPTRQLIERAEQAQDAQAHKTALELPEIPGRYCECPDGPTLYTDDDDAGTEDSQNICEICKLPADSWLHQRQGYHWAHPRLGAGIFMDMGTAKSKVAIALAEGDDAQTMIVVGPTKAIRVWPKQFRLHGRRDWIVANDGGCRRDGKLRPKSSMRQRIEVAEQAERQAQALGRPFAFAVNYEAAWQEPLRTWILNRHWDIAVADESHKIKAPNGKWSRFMERLSHKADRRLLLTGTPAPHDERDYYAQFRFADPGIFGTSYAKFLARFFQMGGFEGREIERENGLGGFLSPEAKREFLDLLAAASFVVESDDVLDLPAQNDRPATLLTLGPDARRHYRELLEDWQTQIGERDEDDPLIVQNALSQMTRLSQVTSGHLPHDVDGKREIVKIGTEKITALEDLLDDIDASEPIVIFARFTHDLTEIRALAEKLGRRYAEISGRASDAIDEDGRMVEGVQIAGVQLQAGGSGIDLTRARYCIFYSLDFNLGDFFQSRKRVHRPGQKRPVFYYYLVAEDTMDVTIRRALALREQVVKDVIRAIKTGDYGDLDPIT